VRGLVVNWTELSGQVDYEIDPDNGSGSQLSAFGYNCVGLIVDCHAVPPRNDRLVVAVWFSRTDSAWRDGVACRPSMGP